MLKLSIKSPFKTLAAAVLAGVCLLAAAVPASSAAVPARAQAAAAAEATPISDAMRAPVTVKPKVVEEKTDLYTLKLAIPVIGGMADERYQAELNEKIEARAAKDLDALKKGAEEDAAAAKVSGYTYLPHELIVGSSLKSDGGEAAGGRLSLIVKTYSYTGGAHGGMRVDAYNAVNGAEAEPLTLEKLLGADYKSIADTAVKKTVAADPESYFEDAFRGVDENRTFYVKDGKAYLVFQEYEIAPYAAGIVEIPVSLTGETEQQAVRVVPARQAASGEPVYKLSKDGAKMVPVRAVAERLGYKAKRNEATGAIEVSKGAQWTSFKPGVNRYAYNKTAPLQLEEAPMLSEGAAYVPASFFSEALKLDVTGDKNGSGALLIGP